MIVRSLSLVCLTLPALAAAALAHEPAEPVTAAVPGTELAVPDDAVVAEADDSAATEENVPLEEKTLKSMFKVLRFDEDWSALKDPNVLTDAYWPAIKYVDLGDDWYASFGGQFRERYASDQNKNLQGGTDPHNNDYYLMRARLYGDLHFEDIARVYVELISAHIYGNDGPPSATDKNQLDVENLFFDLMGGEELMLRIGRFEMNYGVGRVIGVGDWSNTRKSFQGGLVRVKTGDWNIDAFTTKPVIIDDDHADSPNNSRRFSGVYSTLKLAEQKGGLDLYLLDSDEDDNIFTAGDGGTGGQDVWTVGSRYWGAQDAFDYDAEVAGQWGEFAGDTIKAYMGAVKGGYTFDAPWVPRAGLELDYASGDNDPTDGTKQTYNQLFPSTHPYFGYLDLIGRQNIMSVMPVVTVKPWDTTTFRASYSDFWLASDDDALYGTNGAATLSDPSGNSGNNVGQELDLSLAWAPAQLAPHSEFLFGWSIFFPGRFVDETGDGENAKLLYLQYTFTF